MVVGSAGTMTDSAAIMMVGFAGFFVWVLWIILTSVAMWRSAD